MIDVEILKNLGENNQEDTLNLEGFQSYSMTEEEKLVSMLNTLTLAPQFYKTPSHQVNDLLLTIRKLCESDPKFVAQAIVWSRCIGGGMRTVNQLAAAMIAPYISGTDYAKYFYSKFNKKSQIGGCIFRADDMINIHKAYKAIYGKSLSNAMKKGFASAIEHLDEYQVAKYKKHLIDIVNMVHPQSKDVINRLMHGEQLNNKTWENKISQAGKSENAETKEQAWAELINSNSLPILAALRNVKNISKECEYDDEAIDNFCKLVKNQKLIKEGLINPLVFDLAYENCSNVKISNALRDSFTMALPNIKELINGSTCVIVDCSGSMTDGGVNFNKTRCIDKAGLIAAVFKTQLNSEIVVFGFRAKYVDINCEENVFDIAHEISKFDMGGTNVSCAFNELNKKYDRIIIISDSEVNSGDLVSIAVKRYKEKYNADPYIYVLDLAAYGTQMLKNNKVKIYSGYTMKLFDDIANELDLNKAIDEIKKIRFC